MQPDPTTACDHCDDTGEVLEPSRTPEEPSRMIPCGNCHTGFTHIKRRAQAALGQELG